MPYFSLQHRGPCQAQRWCSIQIHIYVTKSSNLFVTRPSAWSSKNLSFSQGSLLLCCSSETSWGDGILRLSSSGCHCIWTIRLNKVDKGFLPPLENKTTLQVFPEPSVLLEISFQIRIWQLTAMDKELRFRWPCTFSLGIESRGLVLGKAFMSR